MDARSRLAVNGILACTQVVVSAVVLFLLFRFIVVSLGLEALGVWSLVMAISAPVRLGEVGLDASSIRFVAVHLAHGEKEKALLATSTALLTSACLVLLVCVAVWPLLPFVLEMVVSSPDDCAVALRLLPYAFASLWLASVSNAVTASLIGSHRADLSALLQILGNIVWLSATLLLVPAIGLTGLVVGQLTQYAFIAVVGWLIVCRLLSTQRFRIPQWSSERFREMWRYGMTQQAIRIAAMLGEPAAKTLIGYFGTLSTLGLFEMANRITSYARLLLVAANRVAIPHFAKLAELTVEELRSAYVTNVRVMTIGGSVFLSLVAAALPLVSVFWIGVYEETFVLLGAALSLGWFVNLTAVPAFFANSGIGKLRINLTGQISESLAMLTLGTACGAMWMGVASALAWPAGLIVGAFVVVGMTHRRDRLSIAETFGRSSIIAALAGCAVGVFTLWLSQREGTLTTYVLSLGGWLVVWIAYFRLMREPRILLHALWRLTAGAIRSRGIVRA